MTGLERLRKVADKMRERGLTLILKQHGVVLNDIADQIEREHSQTVEDHERQQEIIRDLERERDEALKLVRRLDKTRLSIMQVLAVATEMEHHISGVEGGEDSPVARWALRLRETVRCSPEIKEDVEAARWVREHGGLNSVSTSFDWHSLTTKRLFHMAFPGEDECEYIAVDDCIAELDR